jgi:hypothetical protein
MMSGFRKSFAIATIVAIAFVGAAWVYTSHPASQGVVITQTTAPLAIQTPGLNVSLGNFRETDTPVSLAGFSVCAQNCNYPAPYIIGNIIINYSYAWTWVKYYVNGTCECPARNFSEGFTGGYNYVWKSGSPVPIISGEVYTLTFIVGFSDGKNYTVSTIVTAFSNVGNLPA